MGLKILLFASTIGVRVNLNRINVGIFPNAAGVGTEEVGAAMAGAVARARREVKAADRVNLFMGILK